MDHAKHESREGKSERLFRRMESASDRRNNFLKGTRRWASANDYFPMPLSDSELRQLKYLERDEASARKAWADFQNKLSS
ncbi:MAG: hypothetical protein FMNOHCHN_03371 [Ignavibacteriaceae bacterium]|nr:hypothetical protein [Ignavibacteriaceae bacterium]